MQQIEVVRLIAVQEIGIDDRARGHDPSHFSLDQTLGFITTSVLLVSSFFMARAESAIGYDDRREFQRNLLITAGLGTLFLIGVVGLEWGGELRPTDGVFEEM